MQESFSMKGGDGPYSYAKNSQFQRQVANASKSIIEEAIAEKLDILDLSSKTFCLADLGCSVGPNTFIAMQHILGAVERKYLALGLKSHIPEFQVFFNDHAANDFNTLFESLPTERGYFACGVPGSFHGRLFPESSIHFMYSSSALHWLSMVPEEVLDKNSPAWNKGRTYYTGAPYEVAHAYVAQFDKDMEIFLNARAKELVVGGVIVLIMQALASGTSPYRPPSRAMYVLLESCLMDMVKAGIISEGQMDSFNHPMYRPSLEQMTEVVERNGCFSIERMELINPASKLDGPISGQEYTIYVRAITEGLIAKHFGSEIIDELFHRFSDKAVKLTRQLELEHKNRTHLFVVLKRK